MILYSQSLLPKGCCHVIPYSHEYEESWKCNFLGLAPEVELPLHIKSDETFVLVEISLASQDPADPQAGGAVEAAPEAGGGAEILQRLVFQMASPRVLPEKGEFFRNIIFVYILFLGNYMYNNTYNEVIKMYCQLDNCPSCVCFEELKKYYWNIHFRKVISPIKS